MKLILKKYKLNIIASIIGAVIGLTYWNFIGCSSGHCAISSSPINSSIYGFVIGFLFPDIFKRT